MSFFTNKATSGFGTNTFGTSPFGQSSGTTQSGGLFGTTAFGQASSTPSTGFSFAPTSNTASPFGQSTPATSSIFGSATTTKPFGTFGTSTSTNIFGQQSTTSSLFSKPTGTASLFGQPTGNTLFGSPVQQDVGTVHKFEPATVNEILTIRGANHNVNCRYQSICAMEKYKNKSFEELRFEDYAVNRKGPQSGLGGTGLFGGTSQQQTSTLFGSGTSNAFTSTAQKPGGFSFGSTPATGTSLFGTPATQSTSIFGSQPAASSGFAFGGTSTFGSQSSSLFGGAQQNKPLFGTSAQPSTGTFSFGAPTTTQSTFTFGQPQSSASPFGATTKPAFGSSTSTFGFGQSAAGAGTSLFGAKSTTAPTFSFGTGTTSTAGGLFGSTPQSKSLFGGFGTPASTNVGFSGFGSAKTTQSGFAGFGSTSQPLTGGLFGSTTTSSQPFASSTTGLFGQQSSGFNIFGNQPTVATQASSLFGGGSSFGTVAPQPQPQLQQASESLQELQRHLALSPQFARWTHGYLADGEAANKERDATNPAIIRSATQRNLSGLKNTAVHFFSRSTNESNWASPTSGRYRGKPLYSIAGEGAGTLLSKPRPQYERPSNFLLSPKSTIKKEPTDDLIAFIPKPSIRKLSLRKSGSPKSSSLNLSPVVSNSLPIVKTESTSDSNEVALAPQTDEAIRKENMKAQCSSESTEDEPSLLENTKEMSSFNSKENDASATAVTKLTSKELRLETTCLDGEESMLGGEVSIIQEQSVPDNSSVLPPHPAGIILLRPDYHCDPPLDDLSPDSNGECWVEGFNISREGYGSVFFPGKVNLAGMNLDEIVHIRRKEIIVYPDDEKKPAIGDGLNQRAQVSLHKVYPKQKGTNRIMTDPHALLKRNWPAYVERSTLAMGAQFKDYHLETGTWVFTVPHFSKYGLDDDDDGDESEDFPVQQIAQKNTIPESHRDQTMTNGLSSAVSQQKAAKSSADSTTMGVEQVVPTDVVALQQSSDHHYSTLQNNSESYIVKESSYTVKNDYNQNFIGAKQPLLQHEPQFDSVGQNSSGFSYPQQSFFTNGAPPLDSNQLYLMKASFFGDGEISAQHHFDDQSFPRTFSPTNKAIPRTSLLLPRNEAAVDDFALPVQPSLISDEFLSKSMSKDHSGGLSGDFKEKSLTKLPDNREITRTMKKPKHLKTDNTDRTIIAARNSFQTSLRRMPAESSIFSTSEYPLVRSAVPTITSGHPAFKMKKMKEKISTYTMPSHLQIDRITISQSKSSFRKPMHPSLIDSSLRRCRKFRSVFGPKLMLISRSSAISLAHQENSDNLSETKKFGHQQIDNIFDKSTKVFQNATMNSPSFNITDTTVDMSFSRGFEAEMSLPAGKEGNIIINQIDCPSGMSDISIGLVEDSLKVAASGCSKSSFVVVNPIDTAHEYRRTLQEGTIDHEVWSLIVALWGKVESYMPKNQTVTTDRQSTNLASPSDDGTLSIPENEKPTASAKSIKLFSAVDDEMSDDKNRLYPDLSMYQNEDNNDITRLSSMLNAQSIEDLENVTKKNLLEKCRLEALLEWLAKFGCLYDVRDGDDEMAVNDDNVSAQAIEGTNGNASVTATPTSLAIKREFFDYHQKGETFVQQDDISSADVARKIFQCLCRRKFNEAIELATENGDMTLAVLISQLPSDELRSSLVRQLRSWNDTGADIFIEKHHLRIYILLAGLPKWRLSNGEEIFVYSSMDWRCAFGLFIQYGASANSTATELIKGFQSMVETAKIEKEKGEFPIISMPYPAYRRHLSKSESKGIPIKLDLCYQLLCLKVDPHYLLDDIFTPLTYTLNPLDYHLIWHVWTVLTALRYTHASSNTAANLHCCYAEQLEILNLWHWSIFILQHHYENRRKEVLIMDMLFRNCSSRHDDKGDGTTDANKRAGVAVETSPRIDEQDKFLLNERERFILEFCHVPKRWIYSTKAIAARNVDDYTAEFWYLLKSGQPNHAHQIFSWLVLPQLLLSRSLSTIEVMTQKLHQDQLLIGHIWASSGSVIHQFSQALQECNDLFRSISITISMKTDELSKRKKIHDDGDVRHVSMQSPLQTPSELKAALRQISTSFKSIFYSLKGYRLPPVVTGDDDTFLIDLHSLLERNKLNSVTTANDDKNKFGKYEKLLLSSSPNNWQHQFTLNILSQLMLNEYLKIFPIGEKFLDFFPDVRKNVSEFPFYQIGLAHRICRKLNGTSEYMIPILPESSGFELLAKLLKLSDDNLRLESSSQKSILMMT